MREKFLQDSQKATTRKYYPLESDLDRLPPFFPIFKSQHPPLPTFSIMFLSGQFKGDKLIRRTKIKRLKELVAIHFCRDRGTGRGWRGPGGG